MLLLLKVLFYVNNTCLRVRICMCMCMCMCMLFAVIKLAAKICNRSTIVCEMKENPMGISDTIPSELSLRSANLRAALKAAVLQCTGLRGRMWTEAYDGAMKKTATVSSKSASSSVLISGSEASAPPLNTATTSSGIGTANATVTPAAFSGQETDKSIMSSGSGSEAFSLGT